ncbi:MAG: hypothetical protein K6G61_11070 [Solobacterium sp.]|nr:hypothetical protein [Solobacterium sp.]
MKRQLYSELRTIYETTAADPHTYRLTIKMKDIVDGAVLEHAAETAMQRYPYFRVRLCTEKDRVYFEENTAPVPVIRAHRRVRLGSSETAGHLFAFSYWKNRIYIDVYHGLTDGGGIAPLIRTLLYYYCTFFYGETLSSEGIRLFDSAVMPEEWEDPALLPLPAKRSGLVTKWDRPALQLQEEGSLHMTEGSTVCNIRIPEKEFMRFSAANDGSPAAITALLLARTIHELHPDAEDPAVIAMCVNQRKALQAPYAHQSLVGDVRLPYLPQMYDMPFERQATCFRGMVMLQSDNDMVLDEIRDYQALMRQLEPLSFPERQSVCQENLKKLSACITATVSYVGKASLGDAESYIQEYEALPSTALPSTHVPLTIEISAVHGFFFMNFIQYFEEEDYIRAFIRQIRKNGIDYDVLNITEALWPKIELPPALQG